MTRAMVAARRESHRGQSLAEFALVLPIVLLLIFAVIEGGYFAYAYVSVTSASHEGARRAVLPSATLGEVTSKVVAAAQPIVIVAGNINVCVNPTTCTKAFTAKVSGDRIRVQTTYAHQPLIAMVFGNGTTFNFVGRAELVVE